ncbi:MAG: hypothetical protein KAJ51_05485 [Thermoplasmata archaeon]|nr:hypothetical protein [Thermoplasmata archaeon]
MEDHHHWLASHVEEVTQMLEGKVEFDIGQVLTEMIEKAIVLKMPVEEVKGDIIERYFDAHMAKHAPQRDLAELSLKEWNVKLFCKVTSVNPKEVKVNGTTKQIFYGLLSDQSGTLPFTAWSEFKLNKGDTVRIQNAYTKDWQGTPQVQLGDRTKVEKTDEELEVSNVPIGKTSTKARAPSKEYNVLEFRDGLSNISAKVRIISIEPHEINVNGGKKTIFNGIAADTTGKCRFTAWKDFNINSNDALAIKGCYIKSWKGLPDLQIDDNAQIDNLPDETLPLKEELESDNKLSITQLTKIGGSTGVAIEGIVLDIKKGSGLIHRCPECKRVLQKSMCMVHGKQEGVADLRVKAVVDDGTGTLSVVISKNATEKVLSRSLEDCEALIYKSRNFDIINEELLTKLIAQPIQVHGNVITDDYGLMMICNDVELIEIDVKTEATKLLEALASDGGFGYDNNT